MKISLLSLFLAAFVLHVTAVSASDNPLQPSASDHHRDLDRENVETLVCLTCHSPSATNSTRPGCADCHAETNQSKRIEPALRYQQDQRADLKGHRRPVHFGPHCFSCHRLHTWDISGSVTLQQWLCSTCHAEEEPYTHYLQDDCLLCHAGTKWEEVRFSHDGFPTCESCHLRPEKHRPGRCEFCHDTVDWGHAS